MIKKYSKLAANVLISLIPVALLFLILLLLSDRVSFRNLQDVIYQAIPPFILALGVTFAFKVGNWDLSVGATGILSAIIGGNIAMRFNLGIPGIIIICILVGVVLGTITGGIFRLLKIPSIIVTLGTAMIMENLTSLMYEGRGILIPAEFIVLGKFPVNIIILALVMSLGYYLLYHTKIGYNIKAVGSNIDLAKLRGLDVYSTKMFGCIIAGLFAGMYSFMLLGTLGVRKAVSGSLSSLGLSFTALMVVFLGTAIAREGTLIFSIFFAAVILKLVELAMIVLNLPAPLKSVFIAILVVAVMSIQARSDIFSLKKLIPARLRR